MSFILLVEQAAPQTPSANQVVFYPKSDGLLYSKDDAGTETPTAIVAATQAQLEAGSLTTVYTSPGRQHFHPSAAKAWITGLMDATIGQSYNFSSITDNATGNFSPTFTTQMSNTAYSVISGIQHDASTINRFCNCVATVAGAFQILIYYVSDTSGASTLTEANISFFYAAVFGDI